MPATEREIAGDPQWAGVVQYFPEHADRLKIDLHDFGRQLEHLPEVMENCKVDVDIIGQRTLSIQNHCRQLLNLQD